VVVLDASGEAMVELAPWFEAVNSDYCYQLTPIGAPSPDIHIAEEITDNHFRIAGGTPGNKICWQVTGIRQDAWAQANRIVVEDDKPISEEGYYIHPEMRGAGQEQSIARKRHPLRAHAGESPPVR